MWDNRRPRNRSSHGSSITRPRYSVRLPILDPSPYRSLEHLASTAGRYPVPHITPTTRPGHDDLYRDQHCLVGCSASRGCTCRKCAHVSLHRRPRSSPPTLPSLPPLTRPVSSPRLSAGEHVRPSARGVWLASCVLDQNVQMLQGRRASWTARQKLLAQRLPSSQWLLAALWGQSVRI